MCRILGFPNQSGGDIDGLVKFLQASAKAGGGAGWGAGWFGDKAYLGKGVKITEESVSHWIEEGITTQHGVIAHTRKSSVGPTVDELCQPFYVNGSYGETFIAHNGTWNNWQLGWFTAKLNDRNLPSPSKCSDSLVMAELYQVLGPSAVYMVPKFAVMTLDKVVGLKVYVLAHRRMSLISGHGWEFWATEVPAGLSPSNSWKEKVLTPGEYTFPDTKIGDYKCAEFASYQYPTGRHYPSISGSSSSKSSTNWEDTDGEYQGLGRKGLPGA